jgi:type II secretory pathway component GspD/PulD (secretin)
VVNKVPLLGDVPLLGMLFRSKFEEVTNEHVLFAISPRIIQSSEFRTEL